MAKPYVFDQQQPILRHQWDAMHVTRHAPQIKATAQRLLASKSDPRVLEVERRTGVPWYVILIIFEREAGGPPHWGLNIAQGDHFNSVSQHEPKGRGPFASWTDAAFDALVTLKGYDKLRGKWSIERILFTLQPYNGLGYFYMGIPSPYVWSCSDQYDPPNGPGGKYDYDHHFNRTMLDEQIGCAPLLRTMIELDSTIQLALDGRPPAPAPEPSPQPVDPRDPDVIWLQEALNKLGEKLTVDGAYGRGTMEAVRRFQSAHGLPADGLSGPMTEATLRSVLGTPLKPKPVPVPQPVPQPKIPPHVGAGGVIATGAAAFSHWWGVHPGATVAVFVVVFLIVAIVLSKLK